MGDTYEITDAWDDVLLVRVDDRVIGFLTRTTTGWEAREMGPKLGQFPTTRAAARALVDTIPPPPTQSTGLPVFDKLMRDTFGETLG